MTEKIDDILKQKAWHWVQVSPFKCDDCGYELDGKWQEPTFDWFAQIIALRSDAVWFHVDIVLSAEEVEKSRVSVLDLFSAKLVNAFMSLETFRNCDCIVGEPCDFHK